MTQKARPIADYSTGDWTPIPVYQQINEQVANDSTFVSSKANPNGDTFVVDLDFLAIPANHLLPHTLRVRLRNTDNPGIPVSVRLYTSTGLIAVRNFQPTTNYQTYEFQLTQTEARSIDDYLNIQLKVVAGYTVQVPCCSRKLPDLLIATVPIKTGDCWCMPDSFAMTWNSLEELWESPFMSCAMNRCEENDHKLTLTCWGTSASDLLFAGGFGNVQPKSGASCDPLSLEYSVSAHGGTYDVIITE